MSKIDYIIAGGGIAGVCLAHQLVSRKLKFQLYVGDKQKLSSSRVAAGLYNPVTGRKMVKTWKADQLFPYLQEFYEAVERDTGEKILHQKAIYRPFFSVEEQNDWLGKSSDSEFARYIRQVHTRPKYAGKFYDPYGGLELKCCGWLETAAFIDCSIKYFEQLGVNVIRKDLEDNKIDFTGNLIRYEQVKARYLIFCEGVELINNQFFNWLPLKPLKGEILDVELPFQVDDIFNRGVFVLPARGNIYRVGSTYSHENVNWEKTEAGKRQLSKKLSELVVTDYKIIDHIAGVRPATKDRRPFLGRHPKHSNLFIFNGLGTKGVSLAPFFSRQLVEFTEDNKDLDEQVNIQRHF